ncbi:hypothetical protein GGR52DRAFT_542267 [Hypoxylon sp. FL1284]|nr:hypothetical protein GGR52DRAFT_542267 [Hypoxylon sp. FL1284]
MTSSGQNQAQGIVAAGLLGYQIRLPNVQLGGYDPEVPVSESIPPDPQRPLSPFATRHGVSKDPFWRFYHPDNRAHSGLAPEFPDTNGLPSGQIPKPSNEELDRLFYAERGQARIANFGPRTWQLSALGENLAFDGSLDDASSLSSIDPYADWRSFLRQAVQIDQDRWLSCFGRNHWLDLRTNLLRSLRNPTPGLENSYSPYSDRVWWSMDNEVVSSVIDIALEVANRVLRQLCLERSEWLDTILFAIPSRSGQDPRYNYDELFRDDVYRWRPRPERERATSDELWSRLERLTAKYVCFGFTDENVTGLAHGVTRTSTWSALKAVVTLDVKGLRPLFEMDSTLSERCVSIFFLFSTIVHELMHAVVQCRDELGDMEAEPLYNEEWIAEIGHSFENAVFGGSVHRRPDMTNVALGRNPGYPSHVALIDWPSRYMGDFFSGAQIENNGKSRALERAWECYLVPTEWVSAMFSETFWADVVSSRGSAAFRPPRVLGSQMNFLELDELVITSCRPVLPPRFSVPELENRSRRLVGRWKAERRAMLQRRSEWYNEEYASWQLLPWSELSTRELINQFRYYHARRNLVECRKIEAALVPLAAMRTMRPYTPNLFSFQYIIALLMPWYTPASSPKPAERLALLWPSSATVTWFRSLIQAPNVEAFHIAQDDVDEEQQVESLQSIYTTAVGSPFNCLDTIGSQIQTLMYPQGGPASWIDAVIQCYTQIRAEREANPDHDIWTSFPFSIPPYDPGWVTVEYVGGTFAYPDQVRYGNYNPWQDLAQGSTFFPSPPSSPPPGPAGGSGSMVATRSMTSRMLPSRRVYTQYFYISHVANHRSLDNAWVVEPDDLLKELRTTEEEYHAVVATGPQGPTLIRGDPRAEAIRARLSDRRPIGKLILLKRAEELAESNGRNGQPSWISLGPQIYDITKFPFRPADIHFGLPQSAGGPMPSAILENRTRADDLVRRLNPYLCGYLDMPQPARHMQHFTPRRLRWFDNPDLGIYIAVNNVVYDITSYLRFHPGGNRLLLRYTGQDATAAFQEYHDLDLMSSYEKLAVGYLVPEIEMRDMRENQVAVHDWVFDISPLANEDPSLYAALNQYCGVDTTDSITRGDAGTHSLVTLFLEKKNLIVAGLAKTGLPDFPRGELVNHRSHRLPGGAYVVANRYVYNTTHLMRYPDLYERKLGPNWAGREITMPGIAQWLTDEFSHRCIARLVEGPAWEQPDVNVDP